ncbi:MAG TPA: DUF4159 domain-containing protein [Tepidisphaeraceae bacterium]|nr:DUF4159 domain-containing protein [Tepidisphaeraceae bacterium]
MRMALASAVAVIAALASAPAARGAASSAEVDTAIQRAVAYLYAHEKNGNWETIPRPKPPKEGGFSEAAKWGGESAIATYALLAANESPRKPEIQKAIKWLMDNDLRGTYAVGLRSQVWNLIPAESRTRANNQARDLDRDFVLASRIQKGRYAGYYGYSYGNAAATSLGSRGMGLDPNGPPANAWFDRSNSQYGVLGAWALEQAGAEIPFPYWKQENEVWTHSQHADGGWSYRDTHDAQGKPTYTMTSAGIATLFITQDYIMRENYHIFDVCHGGVRNEAIEKGLAWMDHHIDAALNPGASGWYFYGLYGIERIGVASGRKYFNTVNWYDRGSDALVHSQGPDGSWAGTIHDTCFGLLFLVRGRAPVMMNKLQYDITPKRQADPWNERPRDVANLAKWMGKHSLEGYLNWQIVNLKVNVDELHDAPILYIAGSEELKLSDADIAKLRLFVEQGGMILGNADCSSRIFGTTFKKLGNKMFPKYEFRRLPINHPIYNEQYHARQWKRHPLVEGMSNGVREIMILIPDSDPSRAWQTDSAKTREESFQLAGNIFLYATDKQNLAHKGETYIVNADGPGGREVKVARVEAGENWDPEPGAWRRFCAIVHNDQHIDLEAEPVKLGEGALHFPDYKIAALTGATKFVLNDAARKELKDFVDAGGTLIVDAAGGSTDFADSAESELKTIFGAAAANALSTPLALDDMVYSQPKITSKDIVFRNFARRAFTGAAHDPRIRGIRIGDRIGVFYSREDLTAGLVGEPVDGIVGYTPASAVKLMTNMVLYASAPK